ncbi:cell growth-regulating nucleolar protein lyar [Anaeramoeba flamelloides]|uniref:Cell growth-regulating nucleolar protein lyar n=1 Tax=Anaeramoeba flamelloides TaxID=1746091 RepID=A0ABQ8Y360_9EUKA|nr:cell growth-regulating nucleolar protein lyar [Anaeramoeba flamelloides]
MSSENITNIRQGTNFGPQPDHHSNLSNTLNSVEKSGDGQTMLPITVNQKDKNNNLHQKPSNHSVTQLLEEKNKCGNQLKTQNLQVQKNQNMKLTSSKIKDISFLKNNLSSIQNPFVNRNSDASIINQTKNALLKQKTQTNEVPTTPTYNENKSNEFISPKYTVSTQFSPNNSLLIEDEVEKKTNLFKQNLDLEDRKSLEKLKKYFYKFGLLFKGEVDRMNVAINLLEEQNILPKPNSVFNLTKSVNNYSIIHAGFCQKPIKPIFTAEEIMYLLDYCKNVLVLNCRQRHKQIKLKRESGEMEREDSEDNKTPKKKEKEKKIRTKITPKDDQKFNYFSHTNSSKKFKTTNKSRSNEKKITQIDDSGNLSSTSIRYNQIESSSSFSESDIQNDEDVKYNLSSGDDDDVKDESETSLGDMSFEDLSQISSIEDIQTNLSIKNQNYKLKNTSHRKKKNRKKTHKKKPKKKQSKKHKKKYKKRTSKVINLDETPPMCPYCYEPKDIKGHPLQCTKLQNNMIKTDLQKHKFAYVKIK